MNASNLASKQTCKPASAEEVDGCHFLGSMFSQYSTQYSIQTRSLIASSSTFTSLQQTLAIIGKCGRLIDRKNRSKIEYIHIASFDEIDC